MSKELHNSKLVVLLLFGALGALGCSRPYGTSAEPPRVAATPSHIFEESPTSIKTDTSSKVASTQTESNISPDSSVGIVFDSDNLELGSTLQGQVVSVEVGYTNTGQTPVIIDEVGKSCGCTEGEISKTTLQPGDKGMLTVTYTAEDILGVIEQNVILKIRGREEPVLFTFRVNVEPRLELLPQTVKLLPNSPQLVRLESREDDLEFKVTDIESPTNYIVVDNVKQISPRIVEFRVNTKKPIPTEGEAAFLPPVAVQTNIPNFPKMRLYVRGAKT